MGPIYVYKKNITIVNNSSKAKKTYCKVYVQSLKGTSVAKPLPLQVRVK